LILALVPVVGKSLASGSGQPFATVLADRLAAAVVLVIGSDISDRGIQPDRVVLDPDELQLGVQKGPLKVWLTSGFMPPA